MPLICCGIGECNFTGATCYRNGGTQAVAIANGWVRSSIFAIKYPLWLPQIKGDYGGYFLLNAAGVIQEVREVSLSCMNFFFAWEDYRFFNIKGKKYLLCNKILKNKSLWHWCNKLCSAELACNGREQGESAAQIKSTRKFSKRVLTLTLRNGLY